MGITFVQRLKESTGMSPANVAGAYVIVRDIFHLPHWFRQIEALDHQVSADVQLELMDELEQVLGIRAYPDIGSTGQEIDLKGLSQPHRVFTVSWVSNSASSSESDNLRL